MERDTSVTACGQRRDTFGTAVKQKRMNADPIEFTYNGRTHRYRPMSQPTHLWEEIDFDSLQHGEGNIESQIMIRMNKREW